MSLQAQLYIRAIEHKMFLYLLSIKGLSEVRIVSFSLTVLGEYLGVFKSQFTGKFLPVWFADVFLLLESSFQGFSLEV